MVESVYKTILLILMLAVSLGFFFAISIFLARGSCSSSNDNLCVPSNNSYYKTEWYVCWKTCAPKTPRLNAKTCDCTCVEKVYL